MVFVGNVWFFLNKCFFGALLWCVTSIMTRSWFLSIAILLCAVQLVALLEKCALKSFDRGWWMFALPAPFKMLVFGLNQACGSSLYCTRYCTASQVAVPFYFTTFLYLAAGVRSCVQWCCFAGVVFCDALKGHSGFILRVRQSKKKYCLNVKKKALFTVERC